MGVNSGNQKNSTTNYKHLEGVEGWLRFLVVCLMVLSPLAIFGRISAEIQEAETQFPNLLNLPVWSQMKEISWIFGVIQGVLLVGAGFILWKTRLKSTPKRATMMLWIGGPLTTFMGLLAIAYVSKQPLADVINHEALGSILASCISALIWSIYLARSVRVKNTYIQE